MSYMCSKLYIARIGWLVMVFLLMLMVYFLFVVNSGEVVVYVGIVLMGLISGFMFVVAVLVMFEFFGFNSVGVNYNIFIMNIFIGLFVYGVFFVVVYDFNVVFSLGLMVDLVVCMGSKCYGLIFVLWGCIFILGLVLSLLLFVSISFVYDSFE